MAAKAERTKQAILEVSEDLFSSNGYEATSLDAIGARVGLQGSAILYHFPNKRSLYDAVLDGIFAPLVARIDEIVGSPSDVEDRAEAITRALVQFASNKPAAARLILRETVGGSAEAQGAISALGGGRRRSVLAMLSPQESAPVQHPAVLWHIILGSICFHFASSDALVGVLGHSHNLTDSTSEVEFEEAMVSVVRELSGRE